MEFFSSKSQPEPLQASDAGYASRQYAESLSEFGTVHQLANSGSWLLLNTIANTGLMDGMGCYPLFSCHDWRALETDLGALKIQLVSVRVVADPLCTASPAVLQAAFPDVCYVYKDHFVTDLHTPLEKFISLHHRRNVRKALHSLEVRQANADAEFLATWQSLYGNLICRHGIQGVARFSPAAFARQVNVPGFIAFEARDNNTTCGVTLWYHQGDVAHYHLGAYSDRGYELRASYALFWHALTFFTRHGLRYASLGAGAGVKSVSSGLTRFKAGWATHTRPAYFCGRILQPAAYAKLAAGRAKSPSDFFPVYRAA